MIYHGTDRFVWPSIQRDSAILAERIALAQKLVELRRQMAETFERAA